MNIQVLALLILLVLVIIVFGVSALTQWVNNEVLRARNRELADELDRLHQDNRQGGRLGCAETFVAIVGGAAVLTYILSDLRVLG